MADSPTGREPPTAHEQWVLLHGGQGGTSLEYQTYTSAHPFDTIVAGLPGGTPTGPRVMVAVEMTYTQTLTQRWTGETDYGTQGTPRIPILSSANLQFQH